MKLQATYKGYQITVVPMVVREGGFTAHGTFLRHRGYASYDTPFHTGERHATAHAALRAGLAWAKKKIDGV